MPDAPNAPRIAVTIPKSSAAEARAEFQSWGGILSARILGESETEIGMYVSMLASSIALSLGLARDELEKRLRKVGGRVGAKDEWLIADQDLGDFLAVER